MGIADLRKEIELLRCKYERLRGYTDNLIRVSGGWHDVDDCYAEGRVSCEFCAAIRQAKEG